MKALFLGAVIDNWTNKKTGELGTSYVVSVSTDEEPSASFRVDKSTYQSIQSKNLTKLQPVELEVGFVKRDLGGHSFVLKDVNKLQKAA